MVMAKNRFQSFVPIIKQKKSMLKKKDKFLFSDIIQYDVRIRNTNFLREQNVESLRKTSCSLSRKMSYAVCEVYLTT